VEGVGGLDDLLADDGVGAVGAERAAESVEFLLLDGGGDEEAAVGVGSLAVVDDERVGDVVLGLDSAGVRGGGGEFVLIGGLGEVLFELDA